MTAVVRHEDIRRWAAAALWSLVVAAVYYGAGRLGLLQQVVRGQVTPLWPPTGVALAALLVLGLRIWPGIMLGALLVNAPFEPVLAVPAIVAGNTVAPVCAFLLLRRAGFHNELDRLRDALALVSLGALGGMLISATVGSGALALAGAVPPGDFWQTWSVWWTGDAMGVLVVTPFLLVLRRAHWPPHAGRRRWAEAAALLVSTLAVTVLATSGRSASLLFLVSPFLIWAAFRFRLPGAAPCALAVSTLAIFAAVRRVGPFADQALFVNMVTLQAFNGVTALTALLLAAVITERDHTHEEIKRICARLAEMVAHAEPRPSTYEWPPPEDDEGREGDR
ncbi:MASE1 domain-containing protein [Streptomyces sannanensis]|uniref:MASE1 domain-containing protein n=1 Tax=Streptomyces sannanensis TaxID=285536 RepID=A0ABP6SL84_9ACTN